MIANYKFLQNIEKSFPDQKKCKKISGTKNWTG